MNVLISTPDVFSLTTFLIGFWISFLFNESKAIQPFFNSLVTSFFNESISILFALGVSKVNRLVASLGAPFFKELYVSMLFESPKIRKKKMDTVK